MSISVHCQWCGAANNTAGRCTDMMCRGGDTRPAVVEVGIDLRDAEIARLRKQVEDLIVAAGGRWRRMATSTTCGETWEQYALERDAEIAALRARVAELEADIASRSGTWTRCRCGGTFRAPKQTGMSVPEHTCPGCRRAEVAEDRVAALEAVERAAREYRRLMRFCMESPDSTRQDEEDRDVAEDALDAALAALEVPRG